MEYYKYNVVVLKLGEIWLFVVVAVFAVAAGYLAWEGAYDLFGEEFGVHSPRVKIEPRAGWHAPRVTFSLNTPTLCSFAALTAGLFSLYGATRFYVASFTRGSNRIRYLVYQGVGFAAASIAALVYIYDFFTTAFDGVG